MRMKTLRVYPFSFSLCCFSSYAVGCYPVGVYRIDRHAAIAAPDEYGNTISFICHSEEFGSFLPNNVIIPFFLNNKGKR